MRFSAGTSEVTALSKAAPRSAPFAAATLASEPKRLPASTGAAWRATASASRIELECSRGCRSASSSGAADARRDGVANDDDPRFASVTADLDCAVVMPTRRNASRSSFSCPCPLCCRHCCVGTVVRVWCSRVSRCDAAVASSASRDERRENSGDATSLPLEPLFQPPIRPPDSNPPDNAPSTQEAGASWGAPEATTSCWPCGR